MEYRLHTRHFPYCFRRMDYDAVGGGYGSAEAGSGSVTHLWIPPGTDDPLTDAKYQCAGC